MRQQIYRTKVKKKRCGVEMDSIYTVWELLMKTYTQTVSTQWVHECKFYQMRPVLSCRMSYVSECGTLISLDFLLTQSLVDATEVLVYVQRCPVKGGQTWLYSFIYLQSQWYMMHFVLWLLCQVNFILSSIPVSHMECKKKKLFYLHALKDHHIR